MRAHTREDFAVGAKIWADPIVFKYIGGAASSPQRSWARLLDYAGLWVLLGYGYWAVEENATGAYIGDVGFGDFQREIATSMRDVPEFGWVLAPSAHGRGLATEATFAAREWGDQHLPGSRTVCIIDGANTASIRIAEKLGFNLLEHGLYNGTDTLFFERIRA